MFSQSIAEELAKEEDLVFLCGHYEGIDERALELVATDYLSIGDYVLTGGELPAMVMIDSISRPVSYTHLYNLVRLLQTEENSMYDINSFFERLDWFYENHRCV